MPNVEKKHEHQNVTYLHIQASTSSSWLKNCSRLKFMNYFQNKAIHQSLIHLWVRMLHFGLL